MTLILDIGCGTDSRFNANPHGDVNCDIDLPKTRIPNFVRCDARFLPFRNGTFKTALLFNILEHIEDYKKAITESLRVSKHIIVRTDCLFTFRNLFTLDHRYISLGSRYVRTPPILRLMRRIYEKIMGNSKLCFLVKLPFRLIVRLYYGGYERSWHYFVHRSLST